MRWIIALLVAGALLEAAALRGLPMGAPRLEVTLIVVVGWAMLRGWEEGLLAGLIGGLIVDSLSLAPFGVHSLRLGAAGLGAGLLVARWGQSSPLLPVTAAALASMFAFTLSVLALQASGWSVAWERALATQAIPSAALAACGMAIGFPLLRLIERRSSEREDVADVGVGT
jgi:rod shape-determining protein MreD